MKRTVKYGFGVAVLGLTLMGFGAASARAAGGWTDYYDGFGFLLEGARTRVYADIQWDQVNHLSVTCDDLNGFATAQEIDPLGDVTMYYLWDNVTETLYYSGNGDDWFFIEYAFPPGFDLQVVLCSPGG